MLTKFQKTIFTLPDPLPENDHVVVVVSKMVQLFVPDVFNQSRFEFSNRYLKLFWFILNEGPFLALRKVIGAKFQKTLMKEKRVVVVVGKLQDINEIVVAAGPQECPISEKLVFPQQLTSNVSKKAADEIFEKVYCALNREDRLIELYKYSAFADNPLPFTIREIIAREPQIKPKIQNVINFRKFFKNVACCKVSKKKEYYTNKYKNELFIVGAGAYASSYILPNIKKLRFNTVVDLNGASAWNVARSFKFQAFDTSYKRAFEQLGYCKRPVVIIATYHSTHVDIAEEALMKNPQAFVFIEKPPVTSLGQLERLLRLRESGAFIEIGYNRRYSKIIRHAKSLVEKRQEPVSITCVVKELKLPQTHWYYWPSQGTRITGNLCHWIDLAQFIISKKPVSILQAGPVGLPNGDEISAIILYEDGSKMTISSTDRGNSLRGVQEYIDIRSEDLTIKIDDFKTMSVMENGHARKYRYLFRDKGHKRMYREFVKTVIRGHEPLYKDKDLLYSTAVYIQLTEMCRTGTDKVDMNIMNSLL